MLTEKENRTITDIMSGRRRRMEIRDTTIFATIFLIVFIISFPVRDKLSNTVEEFKEFTSHSIMQIKTNTELEKKLKSDLVETNHLLLKISTTHMNNHLNWLLFCPASWFAFIAWELYNCRKLERIIKKLQEERK